MEIDAYWRRALWSEFGAAVDMLANAIRSCPDDLWSDGPVERAYWYLSFHTLFFLDLYTYGKLDGFAPPPPFTLDELDPAGVYPQRVYSRDELLAYLAHCRAQCRTAIGELTTKAAARRCVYPWVEASYGELVLRNLRHIQHHTAQLHWMLRSTTNAAPGWVGAASDPLDDA